MNTDTAEPAFPGGGSLPGSNHRILGMTLRDYFAAKAMEGFMANKSNPMRFDPAGDAKWAYQIADAMLEARQS